MGYNYERIKSNGKLFYHDNTGNSILSVLIFMGVTMGAVIVLYIFIAIGAAVVGVTTAASGGNEYAALISLGFFMIIYLLALAAVSVALMPLSIGLLGWYRKSIYEKTPLGEIFAPYKKGRFWGSVGAMALMSVFIWLWSLLFIIPGIIKSYSYAQTVFIKAENPNIPASRAIELSKIMMEGHKGDLFYLHLSFIGWMLLSSITYNILGIVYVYPYMYASMAFAYEEIKADAISKGLINAEEFQYVPAE